MQLRVYAIEIPIQGSCIHARNMQYVRLQYSPRNSLYEIKWNTNKAVGQFDEGLLPIWEEYDL